MTIKEREDALRQWRVRCDEIRRLTSSERTETAAERARNIARAQKNYNYCCERYFSHYMTDSRTGTVVHNAPFQNEAAETVLKEHNLKGAFIWPRGHAKSTHFDIFIPIWLMIQTPREINVMVIVGKSQDNANTLLSDIQSELQCNKYLIADFGEQYNAGSWEEGHFVTKQGVAFFALGRGQSPRGLRYHEHRPDYIVTDDIDDDELCRNPARVTALTNWVKEALFGALNVGRGRFIIVGNLMSKCSVLYNLSQNKAVHVSRVNALDKNGRVSWPDKWTRAEVDAQAAFMGYRSFQREMMNNPIVDGAVFRYDWIRYKKMLPLDQYEHLVAYCDPSFKGTTKNDYKAIKVWGRPKVKKDSGKKSSPELHNLFAFVRQCSVGEMVRWFYDLHERLPENVICDYYMEANFMQDTLLDEFKAEGELRGYQLPLRPDRRKKPDKFQRIEAVSPLWERGFTFYNIDLKDDPDMQTAIEQTLAFQRGTSVHDDGPDADEGAIWLLQKTQRAEEFTPVIGKRISTRNSW